MPEGTNDEVAERMLECMAEVHNLTRLPRTGWIMAGVKDPESVSDHCYEAAVWAYLLARHVDGPVDTGKVVTMLLFHELGETRLTDLPRRAGPYIREAKGQAERGIVQDVLRGVSESIEALLEEFHARSTLEARLAEAAEELQIIFASMMYAKESIGDMTEYRNDVAGYKSYDIDIARRVADVIGDKLAGYLGDKPYWEVGYRREV
jgi:putative hydrolase of HD superfamily